MTTTFQNVLDELRRVATDSADLGTRFEQLMCAYFRSEASYAAQFSKVWRWCEFPHKEGFTKQDTGIDLVAEYKDGSGFVAIQCKCYQEDAKVAKSDIDSFLATSSKATAKVQFTRRIIVATTANWSQYATDVCQNQTPPVKLIGLDEISNSNIDWSKFSAANPSKLVTKAKKELRKHQEIAVDAVLEGFKTADRGKMIMACGTGKTFTSLKIAERVAGRGGSVVFLVPSLSLLSQTLHEWLAEAAIPLRCYAVCSDEKIGKRASKDDDTIATTPDDLAIPATTNARILSQHFIDNNTGDAAEDSDTMTVVFSTYHSIEVLSDAQKKHGVPPFDLIICDEAHRTTGVTLTDDKESQFVRVHNNDFLRANKRLYMTATPRLYSAESKKKADDAGAVLCSMDDETLYGQNLYTLGFSEAVEKKLLSDYKVIVLSINERYASRVLQQQMRSYDDTELEVDDVAKMIGCWNGLAMRVASEEKKTRHAPLRRAVVFASRIKDSKRFRYDFEKLVEMYCQQESDKHPLACKVRHVDGTMNALERNEKLQWLKEETTDPNLCRILSNAKCLSEGVDVPALDAVIFLNPRKSQVDVVQSVGRVMRRAPGKEYGYIILPVVVPSDVTPEDALDDNERYRVVWEVLQALRAHDDRFDIMINQIELNKNKPGTIIPINIGGDTEGNSTATAGNVPEWRQKELDLEEIEEWRNALFAKIVIKCGEKRYWEQWASDVAEIAQKHSEKIRELLSNEEHNLQFQSFLAGLHLDLNPDITEGDAIEMLSQHLITKPVFDALFGNSEFTAHNPVSQAMEKMIALLEDVQQETERDSLAKFYASVQKRASGVDNAAGKQKIVIELYDKFFKTAFPLMAQRLGIVYTPIEVVDFILHSVDHVLRTEFGGGFNAKGNDILDPFTGTGTFIVRLLQSGLIEPKNLRWEYEHEIHANELVLLAYYIAAVNIEQTFHEVVNQHTIHTQSRHARVLGGHLDNTPQADAPAKFAQANHTASALDPRRVRGGDGREVLGNDGGDGYTPFPGIVLTDTFTMLQEKKLIDENSKRAKRQRDKKIRVIIGNPPYSAGQRSENDANKNTKYDSLDKRIAATYALHSTAVLKNSLYDSYIRAIRWASDRIGDKGVIGFVTNGSFIDGNAMDGLRKCLAEDFTDIYIFNCRGNQRTSGEISRKEGGKIFGSGSRTPVAITILVKNPANPPLTTIHYRDIGDYLDREEKLQILRDAKSIENVAWEIITPNEKHDWVNQREGAFDEFLALGDATCSIFEVHSNGLKTNRDAWCYNFSSKKLSSNIRRMIAFYNEQVAAYREHCEIYGKDGKKLDDFIVNDDTKISWTVNLKKDLAANTTHRFIAHSIVTSCYRPFCKAQLYFNADFNERPGQNKSIFPEPEIENLAICLESPGGKADFSCLMSDTLPDLHLFGASQCFPFYTYELVEEEPKRGRLVAPHTADGGERIGGYIRRENISDAMLEKFRERYKSPKLTKWDIFYYVYGVLNSQDYRERFSAELKKQLPRVPFATDFWGFSRAGKQLAELHLNYETGAEYPLQEQWTGAHDYRVTKMKFPSKTDKTAIVYNPHLTLAGIPPEAYRFVVNGKSAIEWILDRYQKTTHKDSQIENDPNDWCAEHNSPDYIVQLIKRVTHLSVESVKIIEALPKLEW